MPAGWALTHETRTHYFYLVQILFGCALVAVLFLTRRRTDSGFKVRESERLKSHVYSRFPGPVDLDAAKAHAGARKSARAKGPALLLDGISIDGPAHEILGVKSD